MSRQVHIPGVGTVVMADEQQAAATQRLVDGRRQFILDYMRRKGWGDKPESLSIEQIMEIRAQDGWKRPTGGNDGRTAPT